jgi:hypothetical protein
MPFTIPVGAMCHPQVLSLGTGVRVPVGVLVTSKGVTAKSVAPCACAVSISDTFLKCVANYPKNSPQLVQG